MFLNTFTRADTETVSTTDSKLHAAALQYAAQGIPVFPLVPGAKRPITSNGFKDASTDIETINQWWTKNPTANIGIPTGNGWFVLDVDVKNGAQGKEALAALTDQYGPLPATKMQSTPSGGLHYLLKCGSKEIPCRTGWPASGLDVRGNGGYILAAPSVIDGVEYTMTDDDMSSSPMWLIGLILKTAPAAKSNSVAIREGGRNNHMFTMAVESKRDGLTLEDATAKALSANTECNPPLPEAEVTKTVQSAYRYDAAPKIPAEIAELNQTYALVIVGGKVRIMREQECPIFGTPDFTLMAPGDFRTLFSNRYAISGDKETTLGDYWIRHIKRREYKGIVFTPNKESEGYYNLWRGFAVEPEPGDCSLFLRHIRENIASGNVTIMRYLIAWMADVVQNPGKLTGVAVVLRGKQGTGKGVYCGEFGRLFGQHFKHISQSRHLTGNFNSHLKDCILLFADEACWGGDKQAEGALKALITEPTLQIEAKGQDLVRVQNNVHLMVASNNEWTVPAGSEERRFFILDVGESRMQDTAYFSAIKSQMDNGGREALLDYLLSYNIDGFDLRKFPQTEALFETKMLSASPALKFWYEKLEAGALDSTLDNWNDGTIRVEKLQADYKQFVADSGVRHKASAQELGTQLKKLVPTGFRKERPVVGNKRIPTYHFPTLDACRTHFAIAMNTTIEWPTEGAALRMAMND